MTDKLEIRTVSKRFGGVVALDRVDLTLRENEILGLIGPNGSGKTTMVNVISGYLRPTGGTIALEGRNLAGMAPYRLVHAGMARTFQNLRIFKRRTVLENVMAGQASRVSAFESLLPFPTLRRDARQKSAYEMLDRFGLLGKADAVAGALSFGDQKRLELARAMATEPRVLLLDEPAGGMNPTEIEELIAALRLIRQAGVSILLIEHNMRLVMEVCDRISVLCFGKMIADGTPAEIRAHPEVIASYLGGGAA
jgi:branched-chain amino acid transport system ATP-binding protein